MGKWGQLRIMCSSSVTATVWLVSVQCIACEPADQLSGESTEHLILVGGLIFGLYYWLVVLLITHAPSWVVNHSETLP